MGAIQTITAAASRIISRGKSGGGTKNNAQTTIAWDMFDTVPEVGAYADWIGNAMSGATLFAGKRGPNGDVIPAPAGSRPAELAAAIAGGPDGQSILLGESGVNIAVAGDCWIVVQPNDDSDSFLDDKWTVLSTEEVTVQRGKIKAKIDGEDIEIPEYDPNVPQDPTLPVYFRVWKPSPRRRQESTSPVIRAITLLEELRLLNAAVAAIARSRITGRGVMLVPAGTRFPTQPGEDKAQDSLLDTFIEVASTAIREPESAAATVPIVLEVPGDLISGVKWLQFSSEFDSLAVQLRDEAIRRFATGADVPAEVLMGMGDANHWGAWALTAEALRLGVEPKLTLVCQALTTEWLQPILEAEGADDAQEWVIWFDTSGLRSSSNKSASALEAFKEGLISDEAARRELGFTEADAPSAQPRHPVAAAVDTSEGNNLPVNETQSAPVQRDLTVVSASAVLDSFTADTSAALAEAVDGLVWAALVVANRKMVLTPVVPRPARATARELAASGTVQLHHPVSRENVSAYRLLDNAWVRVPEVAARYGVDPLSLTCALDEYVTALLITGAIHEFDNVPRLLAQMKVAA